MKKSIKVSSLIIALVFLVGMFVGTDAFAQDAKYLNFYPTGQRTISMNAQDYFQVLTSAVEPPTVKSSDAAVLEVELDKQIGDATLKTYQYRYKGLKVGKVTVTVSSKDGLSAKETFVVNAATNSESVLKSDTTGDFKLKQGSSYSIKITSFLKDGAVVKPVFTVGNDKVVEFHFLKQSGSSFYYQVTAVGKVGQITGVYTSASGVKQVRQCRIIIVKADEKPTTRQTSKVKCDTIKDFKIAPGASYSFKLSSVKGIVPDFQLGSKGVFTLKYIKKSGNDYFYKITATGKPGQSAGVYTSAPGEQAVKQCKVTIALG